MAESDKGFDLDKVRLPRPLPEPVPRLLVRCLPPEEVSAGGLVIPDVAKKERLAAEVLIVGDGVPPDWITKGAIVQISAYGKLAINELGDGICTVSANDVLLILSEPKENSRD